MRETINLEGKKYGKLIVLEKTALRNTNRNVIWKCQCECGNITYVPTSCLKSGHTKTCGCSLNKEALSNAGKKGGSVGKHYLSRTKIYKRYTHILSRCYNVNDIMYKNYGGRGIEVCEEWKNDFMSFYNWAMANGYREDLTIDRIDVNGNYEPNNCRWTDMITQANNKTNNHYIKYNGKRMTIAEYSREKGIDYTTAYRQIKRKEIGGK